MSLSFLRSLRARLVIGAAIWISIGITAAGIFISALFREYALNLVDDELRDHLQELVSLVDVDAAGQPELYRALSDPLYNQLGSGYSWQISRAGRSLAKSTSASNEAIPIPRDNLGQNEIRKVSFAGVRGPMTGFERLFSPEGMGEPPLRVQIEVDDAVIDRMLPNFNTPLAISLVLLGIVLIVAAGFQVAFGLQPMSRLRGALAAIGSGAARKLPRNFPSEVQPLVDDLNNLIEVNAQMLLRARTQAGNLAHALKTPLAILTDEAYRLDRKGQDEPASVILQQCTRMQRQIDYQIARARAAASRSVPGVIAPVLPAVTSIVSAMQRLHAAKNPDFTIDIGADCIALCDPMDLNEMIANLIDNACKWANRRVAIKGSLDKSTQQAVITVEDDGAGLPPEKIEQAFQVGERLDERVPGSGLGLPIVRDLAQLYGGNVRLERSELGGLMAILRLPRTP
jgi:signal transduction histidine kinase